MRVAPVWDDELAYAIACAITSGLFSMQILYEMSRDDTAKRLDPLILPLSSSFQVFGKLEIWATDEVSNPLQPTEFFVELSATCTGKSSLACEAA